MKKTTQPTQRTKPTERVVRYQFNTPELLDIGKRLAETQRMLADLEADKSRVTKEFSARISQQEMEGGNLVACIQSGYEMRKMPCTITYHDPKTGMKTTRRDDTGEVVDVQAMFPDEMQEELPLDEKAEAKPETTAIDEAQSAEPEKEVLFPEGADVQTMLNMVQESKSQTWVYLVVCDQDLPTKVRVAAERRRKELAKQ